MVGFYFGVMYWFGIVEFNGVFGFFCCLKEGVKWFKWFVEYVIEEFFYVFYEFVFLYERGIENVVFVDNDYVVEFFV